MTPEHGAHKIAGDWIMGPIDMGDLERRIADAIRYTERNTAATEDALHRILVIAEDAMKMQSSQGHSYDAMSSILHIARYALLKIRGER